MAGDIRSRIGTWRDEAVVLVQCSPTGRLGSSARGLVVPVRVRTGNPCPLVDLQARYVAVGGSQLDKGER